ncbi:MAG: transporter [Gammaproteobacteria bacterium]|nr:transporter [Gammaproteobacteria bacterium]
MKARRRRPAPPVAALYASAHLALLLHCAAACAQDEGARAYELAPAGSQAISVYGMFGRGDLDFDPGAPVSGGAQLNLNGGIIEYAHGFVLAGKAGTWLITLPFGSARRTLTAGSAARTDSSSGIGDLQLTAAFGLMGSPALSEKDYDAYRPRVALSVLTRLYVPTGAYDRNSPVNLGQNRWAGQLGVPLAFYLGDSLLDPSLTSFELIPSAIVYRDNHQPSTGTVSSQQPLLQVEAHITRNLGSGVWVALDGLVIQGGETSTDGVSDHNRQRSLALGATGSVDLSDAVSATLSYTEEVSKNRNGLSGHVIRLIAWFAL